jgi:hypothetical protein
LHTIEQHWTSSVHLTPLTRQQTPPWHSADPQQSGVVVQGCVST